MALFKFSLNFLQFLTIPFALFQQLTGKLRPPKPLPRLLPSRSVPLPLPRLPLPSDGPTISRTKASFASTASSLATFPLDARIAKSPPLHLARPPPRSKRLLLLWILSSSFPPFCFFKFQKKKKKKKQ